MADRCKNCAHFEPYKGSDDVGQCFGLPPDNTVTNGGFVEITVRQTRADLRCGLFRPKPLQSPFKGRSDGRPDQ